ncbi:HAD-IIIC family phosphatase [Streptomyces sp. NRRL F-5126]|uniref:HAD-IIIC family phosphatase n=1 Tax=Streptomyces sp. NRRL F-5126 TaxID=1463857 RepID=UPI000A8DDB1F|nr:HAD-IIIC family phosphatase [Streptomyces sp. NRRL F-5126]
MTPVAPADSTPDPADELLRLLSTGEAVVRYPRVADLLATVEPPAFARACHQLARLDPDAVLEAHPDRASVTVAITGHGTLSTLVPPLTGELARHGILLRPHVSDFGSYIFDLLNPDSDLYSQRADLTLCVLDPMIVFDEVPVPWRSADVQRVFDEKLRTLERIAATFGAGGHGTLVLNTLPLPRQFTAQLVDHRSRSELGAVWREANARLLRMAASAPGLVVIDTDPLVAEGVTVTDARMSTYAKAHLSADLLARYAREIGHLARHSVGKSKKALVLDLDGTLWGGVLGDDGVEGIELSGSPKGEAFNGVQRVVKQIGSQGVLLAVVSKNEIDLVREAFRDRRDSELREDDFVRVIANWRPKHDNLKELAQAVNLGVDSFVFVDDSPLECGLVRSELPGVSVVRVDGDPALHVEKILRDGWFDTPQLTAEDQQRVVRYQEELVRKDFLDSFDSVQDFLRELKVTVRLAPVRDTEIPRVSQLTLRTNQFNLTTRRLQQAQVQELAAAPAARVLTIHSGDRFGDNGLVGAVFTRQDEDTLHIDNFVLSCRVFSRGIEQTALAAVLEQARTDGMRAVYGTYRPSKKNGAVRDLYPRYGFTPEAEDGDTLVFRHDLRRLPDRPEHVSLHEEL